MRPADTTPEAWLVFLDSVRRMSPAERIRRAFELSELVQSAAESGLRRAFPEADDREIFLRAAQQRLGPGLFRKVYGDTLPGNGQTE
jgi:hypothetical protein